MSKSYSHPEVLVSSDWVIAHLENPSIVIVEVNTDLQLSYHQGHVPGAIGWSLHADLEDQTRRDIPTISQLEGLLSSSGIGNETTIVLYGDGNNRSATWAFWILKYYRHSDVRLMNGGRTKWISEGLPISTDISNPPAKAYKIGIPNKSIRATKEYIADNLSDPSIKLLDTRTHEEYIGEPHLVEGTSQSNIYRRGHIPGALHIPWDECAAADGTFKAADELDRMYTEKGVNPDQEVVPYCRLGVRASYSWFTLKYLLGYHRVRNYDGSWTEWGNSIGVPIETGTGSGI